MALAPVDHLRTVLANTLSPDATVRRQAEQQLSDAEKQEGFPLVVLQIVASSDQADALVRQSAAVHFKNMVKKNWDVNGEDVTIQISPKDRDLIKKNLVELMCTVPPQIQSQCSEAISLIAAVDFPQNWDNLLPGLIAKFNTQDMTVLNGVLMTANSIFKRFRYVERNDDLYRVIFYVLKQIQEPFLSLFQQMSRSVDGLANDAAQLKLRFEALRLMCGIFYSLNYQDLPEYFEDHMGEWMAEFAKFLNYKNPILVDDDEETEPSPVDRLQSAIIRNLNLYADKDEEPFLPHLKTFTGLVWHLLLGVSAYPKQDELATTSIRFLKSLVSKQMHRALFQEEATLREIIAKIVVPGLRIREVDEERFEDDPQEFILGDLEGSDTDSRRKCSQELLRAMCRQFESEVTIICQEHIGAMINDFNVNPAENWRSKDVAIHLMLAISIRAESERGGVTDVNDKVNVLDFFTNYIVPELQDTNHDSRPMVKATAIKFSTTFRNQFSKENLPALMPLLISHLASPHVVVHTYSAVGIEKVISAKTAGADGVMRPKFTREDLNPFFEPIFTGLFGILDQAQLPENAYVMKCIMRLLSFAKEDIIPVTPVVIEKLTASLGRVAKNPRNPQFNHYLFESIAVLIRSVCSKDSSFTDSFERLLFPPFQEVLQMDVSEFTPYVFQVLAQLLEYRSQESGLGQSYEGLFPPLVTPSLWERKGNVPALCRLLQAYIGKAPGWVVSSGHLAGLLGVFQKLLATGSTEVSAFDLLGAIVQNVPYSTLQPYMGEVMKLLLTKLQTKKTPRYTRLMTNFLALYVGKFGPQSYLDLLNTVQPGLGVMLLKQIWLPRFETDLPVVMEAKIQVIGLTKLLCENSALLSDADGQQIWGQALANLLQILTSPDVNMGKLSSVGDDDDFETEITYDSAYSQLQFAARPVHDPFPDVTDPVNSFVQAMHGLCSSQPGTFRPLIQQSLQPHPKLSVSLEGMFQKAGLSTQ